MEILGFLLHINSKKLWGALKQNKFKSSNIVLISSATIDVIKFIDGFFQKVEMRFLTYVKNMILKI